MNEMSTAKLADELEACLYENRIDLFAKMADENISTIITALRETVATLEKRNERTD